MKVDEECIKNSLRKRKADVLNIIEKQRQDIQEAGAHLIWKRSSQESLKYDVIIVFPPKGFHIIDSLHYMINERLPNLIIDIKPHANNKEQAFYVTAESDYLFRGAEILGFKWREELTSLQRQSIILYFLNNLRWLSVNNNSNFIDQEFKNLNFAEGEAIIAKLLSVNLIKQVLPLHDEISLSKLRTQWVSAFFSSQPLEQICQYFGVKIALYFAFLGYYTTALVFPALMGIAITIYGNNVFINEISILMLSLFTIIWATIFLQRWQHTSDRHILNWSSIHIGTNENLVRPHFRGLLIHMNTLGHVKISYPEWKRKLFKYLITFPIIAFSLLCVFGIMFTIFQLQVRYNYFINEYLIIISFNL